MLPEWVPSLRDVSIWLCIISIASFAIGGAITYFDGGRYAGTITALTVPIEVPANSILHSIISLELEQGVLQVSSGEDKYIIFGSIQSKNAKSGPEQSFSTDNGTGILTIRQEATDLFDPREIDDTWNLTLNPKIPIDLSVECHTGEIRIDPGSSSLSSLYVSCGTGDVIVNLSRWNGSHLPTSLSLGIGSLTVLLPKDASIAVNTQTGIGSRTIEGLIGSEGSYFYTSSKSAPSVISMVITQGIGDLTIKRV